MEPITTTLFLPCIVTTVALPCYAESATVVVKATVFFCVSWHEGVDQGRRKRGVA